MQYRMTANYHTHTVRCGHGSGTDREYVEKAIEGGIKILGFSDHTPHPFEDGYVSKIRMKMEQLEEYAQSILALKKEYAEEIEIHLGLEVEYYPAYFEELTRRARDCGVEYFLLAQHYLGNEIGERYISSQREVPDQLERYCTQVIEAMETGRFMYFAHPDIVRDMGDSEQYEAAMRRLCRVANKQNMPLEINLLGAEESRHYPNDILWKVAGEEGCRVILGADAHAPEQVCRWEALEKAHRLVETYGLNLIDTMELRAI